MERLNDAQLHKRLKKMQVPFHRYSELNKNNLSWLDKHLHIKNENHRYFQETIYEIRKRLECKEYVN